MAYTTIPKSSDYFNTKLYTGNSSTQTISGVGFQPDFTWIKNRNGVRNHMLFDSVRGALYRLQSNTTAVSASTANTLTSWNSDGFALGSENDTNGTGATFASWNWLANGSGSLNEVGSIDSTVSVNTTSGFSIVSYTGNGSAGATIGHGLSAVPKMMIIKGRSFSDDWIVYHKNIGATKDLRLNLTNAASTNSGPFNNTEPTSSLFTVGSGSATNNGSATFIAYCFADVQGFSKFGSYIGNGNADGTFVYTGFKPAFVMVKNTSVSQDWYMLDNKRDISNVCDSYVTANNSTAEGTYTLADFLSNGFKLRDTGGASNASGNTFIYMAFAEEPLVGTNPATAR